MAKKKVKIASDPNMVTILGYIPQAFHLLSIHNPSNLLYFPPVGITLYLQFCNLFFPHNTWRTVSDVIKYPAVTSVITATQTILIYG